MMVIRFFDDPTPTVESPVLVDCPECRGRGERDIPGTGSQDMNGVRTCETVVCIACDGFGAVSPDLAVQCTVCNDVTVWRGQGCTLHNDVCLDCRPRGCVECVDDGEFDADAYYAGRTAS